MDAAPTRASASAANRIHTVGRLFRGENDVELGPRARPAIEVIATMTRDQIDALAVGEPGHIYGVVTFESLARVLARTDAPKLADFEIGDLLEGPPKVVDIATDINEILPEVLSGRCVVVATERVVQAIITSRVLLDYYARLARPYMLMQEIELTLRSVLHECLPEDVCSDVLGRVLKSKYDPKPAPARVEDLTFDECRQVVINTDAWSGYFSSRFGGNRTIAAFRLARAVQIRNDFAHLREVKEGDLTDLVSAREWLFVRLEHLGAAA